MKKLIIKIVCILIGSMLFVSCNEKSLKDYFITNNKEYWHAYSGEDFERTGVYYQFYKNLTYSRYSKNLKGEMFSFNNEGDIVFDDNAWLVNSDSILTWRGIKYDVVLCNENVIILSKGKDQKNLFLIKDNKDIKSVQYYFEKRLKYPDRYK